MGWLQDISSEFSIRRGKDLISDPHKFAETEMTKSFQSHVGPAMLNMIPVVGPLLGLGAREWLAHEGRKGVYGGKTGQTPINITPGGGSIGGAIGSVAGGYFGPYGSMLGGAAGSMLGSAASSNAHPVSGASPYIANPYGAAQNNTTGQWSILNGLI